MMMKKIIISLLMLLSLPIAYGDPIARIKIQIEGAMHHDYYLCLQDVGCLSMQAGQQGKIFPILHSFEMDNMYVVDSSQGYRVHFLGLPTSCDKTVQTNQMITITGNLVANANQVTVKQLSCSIS